jgi:oxygen-independent coproporphyrinogen-3 oxidase
MIDLPRERVPGHVLSPVPWRVPEAAYVHIPFCAHHCGYCDFAVVTGRDAQMGTYLDALEAELRSLETPRPVRTLFLGGGTPSYLPLPLLERLLHQLRAWFPLAPDGEWTIEANPESLDAEKIALLAEAGVNRVSLGVQSFDANELAVLDRAHDPADAVAAIARLQGHLPRVSLDLIFGVPGQTIEGWRDHLRRALDLGVGHLSTYGLTYEKGTPLWKQRRAGRLIPLGEEAELALYEVTIDTLEAAGLEHYEVSNFARPGQRSRHNETYWANHAYHGVGLGAARYVDFVRAVNTRDFAAYLAGRRAWQEECLTPDERARETMAVQLRRSWGIERAMFHEQTGHPLDAITTGIGPLVEQGLLADTGTRVHLTRRGKAVADGIIERLLRG